ncbi:MAG: hypothetical protein H8D49_01020 [Dehalococcoidia bacterium]|nr:hypothetical protein [Dehalococcoidia bacterium]
MNWLNQDATRGVMIEVHLYGKLRRFTDNLDPSRDSIVHIATENGDSLADIIQRIGIPGNEVGTNIFLNGEYSPQSRKINNDDRLGVFPDDMQMILV